MSVYPLPLGQKTAKFVRMSTIPFDAQNAGYVQALYEQYATHPETVPEAWRRFFAQGPSETLRAGLIVPEGLSTNGHSGNGSLAAPAAPTASRPAVAAAPDPGIQAENGRLTRLLPAVASATL